MFRYSNSGMKSPVGLVLEIGYTIAIPAVVFAFGGRWLDRTYGTEPWFTIAGVLLSLPVGGYAVWRKLKPFL